MNSLVIFVESFFFTKSMVDFKKTSLILREWAQMCANHENIHWHSETLKSEFVLVKDEEENWILYRFSDQWGKVGNSIWTLNGQTQNGPRLIGYADLKDFKYL